MTFLYISNLLAVLIFLGYGNFINSLIFNENRAGKIQIFDIFYGVIYLSFIAILINFFFPLNKFINSLLILFGIIISIKVFINLKNFTEAIKICFYVASISFIIMLLAHSNRPDAGLYHLPFISILNENKIIFGISNIHFRFAHTSILQYISAVFNNYLFLDKGVSLPISIILSSLLFNFYKNFKLNSKNNFFLIFNFLISSFTILKASRYNDIGNDSIGHLFFFLIIWYFLWCISKSKNDYKSFYVLSLFSIFAFANKIFLIFAFVFPIFFLIWTNKYKYLIDKKTVILLFLLLCIFIKNIIISSCIIYPIKTSCISSFSWSSVDKKTHSDPVIKSIEGKAAAKGWSTFKDKSISYEEYDQKFNWLQNWKETHLIYIIKKISPLILLIGITFLIFLIKEKIINLRKKIKKNYFCKSIQISILVTVAGSIYWFISFPIYRYGYSLFVSLIILLISYLFYQYFSELKKKEIYKIFHKILILIIIFVAILNVTRITRNINTNYEDYPWPKIYAFDKHNIKQNNKVLYSFDNFYIYSPVYRLCMYSISPCTHFLNIQDQVKIKKLKNYIIIYPK